MPTLSKVDKAAKISANEAQRRKEVALAEIREMERDLRRGTLVEVAEVEAAWTSMLAMIRDGLLGLPAKIAAKLAATNNEREVARLLKAEIRAQLSKVAGKIEQSAA